MNKHNYQVTIEWTGNQGSGTSDYNSYNRNHKISSEGKYDQIHGSSDPSFLGDNAKYNPEDLFLSSLSACHMLWYLHVCATNKIMVIEYVDNAKGVMEIMENGIGKFVEVTLYPTVKITDKKMISKANELHAEAAKMCFIANSCNFEVKHNPTTTSD
ncbi:OsmC family protein [Christiangramia echinicola]|uniref:OsmC family protein n=1 Tax=Christiangramia echinicola TaxID=279359 RepID=UPI0004076719|nr:OsmC family protein [Christiangramia echinicola]